MRKQCLNALILAALCMGFRSSVEESGTLIIRVDNIEQTGGFIWIGMYDSEDTYMVKEKAIVKGIDVTKTGKISFELDTLSYGRYALALFHDVNGNGELDRNLIGIPSEPYAFSQKPKSKWRLPRFREIAFEFTKDKQVLETRLHKWWDTKN